MAVSTEVLRERSFYLSAADSIDLAVLESAGVEFRVGAGLWSSAIGEYVRQSEIPVGFLSDFHPDLNSRFREMMEAYLQGLVRAHYFSPHYDDVGGNYYRFIQGGVREKLIDQHRSRLPQEYQEAQRGLTEVIKNQLVIVSAPVNVPRVNVPTRLLNFFSI